MTSAASINSLYDLILSVRDGPLTPEAISILIKVVLVLFRK